MADDTTTLLNRDEAVCAEPIPNRLGIALTWLLRVAVALIFTTAGWSKFRDPMWVHLFEQIGLGQWFRYTTGAIEIGGGLLALIPRASLLGLGLLGCAMAGAVVAWVTVLHAPSNAPIPGALLIALVAIAFREYGRTH